MKRTVTNESNYSACIGAAAGAAEHAISPESEEWFEKARAAYTQEDWEQTFDCCFKAAELGHPHGMEVLAGLYARGLGVEKDAAAAFLWYTRAALKGERNSQYNVAIYFMSKVAENPENWKKCARWAYQAARQEHPEAEYLLAHCYGKGLGVIQSYGECLYWLERAAEHGHEEAGMQMKKFGQPYRRSNIPGEKKKHFVCQSVAEAELGCELEKLAALTLAPQEAAPQRKPAGILSWLKKFFAVK